jgi:hypothetical protein
MTTGTKALVLPKRMTPLVFASTNNSKERGASFAWHPPLCP